MTELRALGWWVILLTALFLLTSTAQASPEFDRCIKRLEDYNKLYTDSLHWRQQHYYSEYIDPRRHGKAMSNTPSGKMAGKFLTPATHRWGRKASKQADKCMAILDAEEST